MAEVKYLVVLPTIPNESDRMSKMGIQGCLLQEPEQFSINFVNSPSCTDNITYHFKVRVPAQTIVENYKINGEWSDAHQEKYLNIFDVYIFSPRNTPKRTRTYCLNNDGCHLFYCASNTEHSKQIKYLFHK
ncbi:uncharacterized protein LOC6573600 isoform X3 [Drosophila mojavensis]|uniref:uncharacterized protein LOC6573600 isoform X3 n=1 Tax=Drosophila mojavensis TaxID=7230 RepID=UPI001CD0FD49|nr:uncharacterized protein LOC6573600 isoform X3 [Drosophila mojavensis]